MRQIVLDTETTGLETSQGHRIIEIGCVEMVNRKLTGRHYHQYINPEREIDDGAIEVHGITNEFLADKPVFAHIVDEFIEFINGAELIIHNAPFDVGFIDYELSLLDSRCERVDSLCRITDTLVMARQRHPGQRNSLDALCQRYMVDNSQRELHGALLDAEILADVYLALTGGQTDLALSAEERQSRSGGSSGSEPRRVDRQRAPLKVLQASEAELAAHRHQLEQIDKASEGNCLWLKGVAGDRE